MKAPENIFELSSQVKEFLKINAENLKISLKESLPSPEKIIENYPEVYFCFRDKRRKDDFGECKKCKKKDICAKIFFIISFQIAHMIITSGISFLEDKEIQ